VPSSSVTGTGQRSRQPVPQDWIVRSVAVGPSVIGVLVWPLTPRDTRVSWRTSNGLTIARLPLAGNLGMAASLDLQGRGATPGISIAGRVCCRRRRDLRPDIGGEADVCMELSPTRVGAGCVD